MLLQIRQNSYGKTIIVISITQKLDGTVVEGDEFYIKAGLKGRPYHDEIVRSCRKPCKLGLKPWRGRVTFYKDQPMITCIHERNAMTVFDVPVQQPLVDVVCGNVSYGSTDIFRRVQGVRPAAGTWV